MGDIGENVDGKWEEPIDLIKHRRFIKVNDRKLPVLDLKYEYEAYLRLGRMKRCRMLKEWMEKQKDITD